MKIKSNYFILCEKTISSTSGQFSFINLFNKIYADKLPAGYPSMSLAYNGIINEPQKLPDPLIFELIIVSPGNKKHLAGKGELGYKKEKGRNVSLLMEITNATFDEFGEHTVILKLGSEKIASTSIIVEKKKQLKKTDKRKK